MARAAILSDGKKLRLDTSSFPTNLSQDDKKAPVSASAPAIHDFLTAEEFKQKERANIVAALNSSGWRVSGKGGAAELLGVKPTTLAHQIKKFGILKT